MPARGSKVPGKIGALPTINTSGDEGTFKAAAALLMPLAAKANEIADREAAEHAQSEGIIAGDSGSYVQRSSRRLSGRAFNQAADIALKGRLSTDFKTALLQAEDEFPDDPVKFSERVGGFLAGQMDESGESSPNIALLHKQSTGPSIAAARSRIQTRHERKVDRNSLGAMRQYEETMLREGTIIARSMSDGSPGAWANGEEWLLHNYLDASIQWSQMATSGGTLLTPAQRTAKHIAFGQEFADNLLRGMGTNAVDATQFRDDMAAGNIKIPMVVEDGGKPEVVEVDPYTILPRTKVDAILRHIDAEILRREREQKGASALAKFNTRQLNDAEIFKMGATGKGAILPFELVKELLGEAEAIQYEDKAEAALDGYSTGEMAKGMSRVERNEKQVQLDDLAVSEVGDIKAIRNAETFRKVSGRFDAALEIDGLVVVTETDSFVQSKRQAWIDSQGKSGPEQVPGDFSRGTDVAFQEYIQAGKESQLEQGVPQSRLRVTSNQDLANMVEFLNSSTNGIQVIEFMQAQSRRYGEHFPQMVSEMVSKGGASDLLIILPNLPASGKEASLLAGLIAGEVKQSDLDKLVSSVHRKDIDEKIFNRNAAELDPYFPPGNLDTQLAYRKAMKLLVSQLVGSGDAVNKSVKSVYKTVFGDRYNLDSNTVRVPITEYDNNLGRAIRGTKVTMEILGSRLDESISESIRNLEIVSEDPRFSKELIGEQYFNGLEANGKLYTNSDETGVVLYDDFDNPVVDINDKPLTVTWEELRTAGVKVNQFPVRGMP